MPALPTMLSAFEMGVPTLKSILDSLLMKETLGGGKGVGLGVCAALHAA